MTTESILETLRDPDHELPEEALAEVIRRRDEFVPHLISVLDEMARLAAERPEEVDGENSLPAFAVLLLAQFREATAIEAVLTAFNTPDETRDSLFGDIVSIHGGRILATVCSEKPEALRRCAQLESFEPFGRWSVFQALAVQAAWGLSSAAETEKFFEELFDSNAFGDDQEVWTYLVSVCMDFGARPFLARIRALYDREMIDPEIVGELEDVEASTEENAEELRRRYAESYPPIDDTVEEVAWWPQFDSDHSQSPETIQSPLESLRHPDEPPDEALEEIARRRDEFAPLLVDAIEDAVDLATEAPDEVDGNDCLPQIAVLLLAQFRETSAIEIVLNALDLPDEPRFAIFGGVLGLDQTSRVLGTLASKNPEALRRYVKRESLAPTDRWAGLEALALQASWGERPAEEVVDFFGSLFSSDAYGDDLDAWTYLVSVCVEFGCRPFLDQIRALFGRGLIDASIVGNIEEIEAGAADDPAELRREYAETMPPINDAAEEIWAWDRFDSEKEWADDDLLDPPLPPPIPIRAEPKIGRNDPCPCGSGKKYKKCCLKS